MHRTFGLIIGLIVLTAGLVFFALQSQPVKQPATPSGRVTVVPTPAADTVLTLSPNPVTLTASGSGTVEVMIDTGYNTVSAVQLELGYDPKALTNVSITKGTFFENALELLHENDKVNGRFSYASGITPSREPAQGRGTVAIISFKRVPGATGNTSLNIMDKSLVTMLGVQGSVLKQAIGTTVLLTPVSAPDLVSDEKPNIGTFEGVPDRP